MSEANAANAATGSLPVSPIVVNSTANNSRNGTPNPNATARAPVFVEATTVTWSPFLRVLVGVS